MKQYESYKDSGLEWLGKIPSHWAIVPFKRLFSFGRGLSITKADLVDSGLPVISYGQIHSKKNPGTHIVSHLLRYVPESLVEGNDASITKIGDVLFADTSEDIEGCGNCIYIDKDITLYAGYHTIIAKNIVNETSNYIAYLFKTDCWRSQLRASVNGVKVYSITQSTLGETAVLAPPFSEQRIIASYLDNKVSQIDAVIAEKEKMVEDLQNYRKSLISETVTRGLNPDVPMKDSGIEWIGMIPKHWKLNKLKAYANIQTGNTPSTTDIKYWDNPTEEWYTPSDFEDSDIRLKESSRKLASVAFVEEACRVFDPDTVLIVGIGATLGKVGISNKKCSANQQINAVCFNTEVLPLFGAYYLYSIKDAMKASSYASTLAILNQSATKDLIFLCPPFEEQLKIVEYIDKYSSKIVEILSDLQSQIEDLKSYKSSVITEAVTGKVDLRNL